MPLKQPPFVAGPSFPSFHARQVEPVLGDIIQLSCAIQWRLESRYGILLLVSMFQ